MLVLDSGIRDWVLLPIFVVMLLVGIARSNMMQLIRSDTTVDFDRLKHECVAAPRWPPDACDRRRRSEWGSQLLGRSARVRGSGGVLSADAYATRRVRHREVATASQLAGSPCLLLAPQHFMVNALNPKVHVGPRATAGIAVGACPGSDTWSSQDVKSGGANMMAQTNVMQNMMKGNVTMMIPNVLIMGWVTYFFSGFVLGAKTAAPHQARPPSHRRPPQSSSPSR